MSDSIYTIIKNRWKDHAFDGRDLANFFHSFSEIRDIDDLETIADNLHVSLTQFSQDGVDISEACWFILGKVKPDSSLVPVLESLIRQLDTSTTEG